MIGCVCSFRLTVRQVSHVLGAKQIPGLPITPARGPLVLQLSNERWLHHLTVLFCRGAALAPNPDLALKHLQSDHP